MLLTNKFKGNDYSAWRDGRIVVAGAHEHGAMVLKSTFSARNNKVLASLLGKLPVEVALEEENGIVYAGTWFVQQMRLSSDNIESNEILILFDMVSEEIFYKQHASTLPAPDANLSKFVSPLKCQD